MILVARRNSIQCQLMSRMGSPVTTHDLAHNSGTAFAYLLDLWLAGMAI